VDFGFSGDQARVAAWAFANGGAETLEVCLQGNGCSGYKKVGANKTITYSPNADFAPATFCANAFKKSSNGSVTEVHHVCGYGA
jgi:hypothetical protein